MSIKELDTNTLLLDPIFRALAWILVPPLKSRRVAQALSTLEKHEMFGLQPSASI
uniref:Uncharacterized protein n=1 Tax=Arundo donax TaxID=35708 RepID=A0A0A9GXA8_ARUDO